MLHRASLAGVRWENGQTGLFGGLATATAMAMAMAMRDVATLSGARLKSS